MIVASISVDGQTRDLSDRDSVRIGRAGDEALDIIGLDDRDRGISRLAASITVSGTDIVIRNESANASLYLDRGLGEPLALRPEERFLVADTCSIEIRGTVRYHRVDVHPRLVATGPRLPRPPGAPTVTVQLDLTTRDRAALAALYRGYLEAFPRRDCVPSTYEEAGVVLGVPASTVRRRIDRVRERLAEQGVIIEGRNARETLATYLLDNEFLGPRDLVRLP